MVWTEQNKQEAEMSAKSLFRMGLVLLALAVMGISFSVAAQGSTGKRLTIKQRIAEMEIQVGSIKQQIEEMSGDAGLGSLRSRLQEMETQLGELKTALDKHSETAAQQNEDSQKRIEDLEAQVSEMKEQTETLLADVEKLKNNPAAGYDKHFFVQSGDGKHRIELFGFVRPIYRMRFANDEAESSFKGQEFDIINFRLGAAATVFGSLNMELSLDIGRPFGHVFFPFNEEAATPDYAENFVRLDYDSVQISDAWGEYAPYEFLKIRAGQMKVPFDRETLTDESELTFSNRSMMTLRFARDNSYHQRGYAYEYEKGSSFGSDLGGMIHGSAWEDKVGWHVGVFNGSGSNTAMDGSIERSDHYGIDPLTGGGNTQANDNRDILIAARVWVDPINKVTPGYSDLDSTEDPMLAIGVGFVYDIPLHRDLYDPNETYNSSDISTTLDTVVKYYGAHLGLGLFYSLRDYGKTRPRELIDVGGIMVQAGYYIKWIWSEVNLRYSMFDPDFKLKLDHMHEITANFVHYVWGHNLKVMLEYGGLLPSSETYAYLGPPGSDTRYYITHEIRLGAQFAF